jgi:regulator of protease activity HflC (stomatin/prohibitin superfamily)
MTVLLSLDGAIGLYFLILLLAPLGIALLAFVFTSIWVVEEGTAVVIERFGKYSKTLWHDNGLISTGLHFTIPFVDNARSVTWRLSDISLTKSGHAKVNVRETRKTVIDLRENLMDFPQQPVITRDNVEIKVHPMVMYRLFDPVRVAYESFDLAHAIEKLVQTSLRSVIGDMGLDDTLASREEIQRLLMYKIRKVCQNWGCYVISVELLEIVVPEQVQEAMHMQLTAERERRAQVVTAEGQRDKVKTEAEGVCQSNIALSSGYSKVKVSKANGLAQSRIIIAKAEADAVRIISKELSPVGVNATQYMIGTRYIDVFTDICKYAGSRQVYFPLETNVMGAMREIERPVSMVKKVK